MGSLAEREEISCGVVTGRSLRSIAAALNRAPSTISREINRNGGRQHYRATPDFEVMSLQLVFEQTSCCSVGFFV